jgi:hypothetical protein
MSETVLIVNFENCDPQTDDWVGVYPDGSEFQQGGGPTEYLTNDWIDWVWTCGDRSCPGNPASFTFALPIDPDDPEYNMLNLRAYLIRSTPNGPPNEIVAKSEPFRVIDPCNV